VWIIIVVVVIGGSSCGSTVICTYLHSPAMALAILLLFLLLLLCSISPCTLPPSVVYWRFEARSRLVVAAAMVVVVVTSVVSADSPSAPGGLASLRVDLKQLDCTLVSGSGPLPNVKCTTSDP
jgi:hypothetical protein